MLELWNPSSSGSLVTQASPNVGHRAAQPDPGNWTNRQFSQASPSFPTTGQLLGECVGIGMLRPEGWAVPAPGTVGKVESALPLQTVRDLSWSGSIREMLRSPGSYYL